jgi:hypothetical protein
MKKIIAIALLSFASVATANAAYCRAESTTSYGYGTAASIRLACKRALYECAKRTSVNDTCFVVSSGY